MKIREILDKVEHRPWEIPSGKWKYYQEWNKAIFLHYQVDLVELQKYVTSELEIDLFEDKAWISIVAFSMERIRPRNLPAFPLISNFHEVNIRTYVKHLGKTGVYFLSIEAGKKISCEIARKVSKLPYRFSKVERSKNVFQSENSSFNDRLHIQYSIANKIQQKTKLDEWLTERYALYQDSNNVINAFEIHHVEWPLYDVKIQHLDIEYPRFKNLLKDHPDRINYSSGVKVLAWSGE